MIMDYRVVRAGAGVVTALLCACASGRLGPNLVADQVGPRVVVPAVAPDSLPAGFYDDTNVVTVAGRPGPFIKNVVLVLFLPAAPQHERQAAIDSVQGTVIGGVRLSPRDGLYVVSLPHDPSQERVFRAARVLTRLPGVTSALPDYVFVPSRY